MTQARFLASIKRGRPDGAPASMPAVLVDAFAALRAGTLDHDALVPIVTPFVRAVFVGENISGIETLFSNTDDVDAIAIELHGIAVQDDGLPTITASARFVLDELESLDDDALMAWQEDNDFLTDAVTFLWAIDGEEIVIGDHDGAGFEKEHSEEDSDADLED